MCPDCELPVGDARTEPDGRPAIRYCAHCGQKLDVRALRFAEILRELLDTLFTLELPILRTTRDLLRAPGPVARAWIVGKRRTYINPLKFIVVIGAVVALLHEPIMRLHVARSPAGTAVYDVALAQFSTHLFAFACIALLVPIALAMRALGNAFRLDHSWLEWYVLGLYTYGLGAALQLVLNVASLAFAIGSTPHIVLLSIKGLLPPVLLVRGAFGFVAPGCRLRAASLAIVAQVAAVVAIVALQSVVAGLIRR